MRARLLAAAIALACVAAASAADARPRRHVDHHQRHRVERIVSGGSSYGYLGTVRDERLPERGYEAHSGVFGAGARLVAEARRWIGAGPRALGVPSTLWCADAANMWLRRIGVRGTGSRTAKSFTRYGRRISRPVSGAIAVFLPQRRGARRRRLPRAP